MVLLTCMLGACGTSQYTGDGNNLSPVSNENTQSSTTMSQKPGRPLKAIRMLDHSKGWALTDQNILFTSDGGQNWKDVTPSGSAYGKNAYGNFMNDKYAWVVSTGQTNNVNVLRTNDGGQHWQSSTI